MSWISRNMPSIFCDRRRSLFRAALQKPTSVYDYALIAGFDRVNAYSCDRLPEVCLRGPIAPQCSNVISEGQKVFTFAATACRP
jgi:hypothetical protein